MLCICGNNIQSGTDDNYNSEHTEIFCDRCDRWFYVMICVLCRSDGILDKRGECQDCLRHGPGMEAH
jgi:hypothetical protein